MEKEHSGRFPWKDSRGKLSVPLIELAYLYALERSELTDFDQFSDEFIRMFQIEVTDLEPIRLGWERAQQ